MYTIFLGGISLYDDNFATANSRRTQNCRSSTT